MQEYKLKKNKVNQGEDNIIGVNLFVVSKETPEDKEHDNKYKQENNSFKNTVREFRNITKKGNNKNKHD